MPLDDTPLYPLYFEPIYKQKVWGGRHLERLGRALPGSTDTLIGESWELADLADTSPSGGGGGAERSVVANGPMRGQTLHELIGRHGRNLLGDLEPTPTGDFPLLVKFLDARQNLSLQTHPSAPYAQTHPDAHLKSEAWYIVEADDGAAIYKGVRSGVTPQQLREAAASADAAAVERLLIRVPVKTGECHYLPSGTLHALGAGILAAEVQTPSDTTFRVFDWGRTGRALHLDEALECIQFGPPDVASHEKRSHVAGMFTTISRLALCEYFCIEKVRMVESYEQELPYNQPAVWMILKGAGRIDPGHGAEPVALEPGRTLLIPANMADARAVFDQDTVWLEVTFPQAMPQVIA
jgi:mannose-6-phosphate isomerase